MTEDCPVVSEEANTPYWNDGGDIQRQNNCYNFAVNYATNRFAQPGRAGGLTIDDWTCGNTVRGAKLDGLRQWGTNCYQSGKRRYKVAVVTGTVEGVDDCHWYRLCSDNYWWHKFGSDRVTNLDNSNNPITDPEKADRGPCVNWCVYMQTGNNGISP